MTTWREMIGSRMETNGETLSDAVGMVAAPNTWDDSPPFEDDKWLDVEFNSGFGGSMGCHFTVWTQHFVYFPAVYDGSEWCDCVPRNPCDKATAHVGGE